jgi:hypothetical protein
MDQTESFLLFFICRCFRSVFSSGRSRAAFALASCVALLLCYSSFPSHRSPYAMLDLSRSIYLIATMPSVSRLLCGYFSNQALHHDEGVQWWCVTYHSSVRD